MVVIEMRRAMALALIGWGTASTVVALLLSPRPVGTAAGLLAFVVLYPLATWLVPRSRVEHGWERVRVDEAAVTVDRRRSARFGVLVASLLAVVVLTVATVLDRAFGGDGSLAIGPGVVLGTGVATALMALDLRRWQDGLGRVLLRPAGARRFAWTGTEALEGLVAVPAHALTDRAG